MPLAQGMSTSIAERLDAAFQQQKGEAGTCLESGTILVLTSYFNSSFSCSFSDLWGNKGDELEGLITGASKGKGQTQSQEITNPNTLVPWGKHTSNACDFMWDHIVHRSISK